MLTRKLQHEISKTFGLVPNSYARHSNETAAWMLSYARYAYVEAPLPSLFKQKLFVQLSRFCDSPHCVARHIGYLMGHGFVAGDPIAPGLDLQHVMTLLEEPAIATRDMVRHFSRLRDLKPSGDAWSKDAEPSLLAICTGIFLKLGDRTTAVHELVRFLGDERTEKLLVFLSFIAHEHRDTELASSLEHDFDVVQLLAKHHVLSRWLAEYRGTSARQLHDSFESERLRLAEAQDQLASQATRLINAARGSGVDPDAVLSSRELATFEFIGRGLSTRDIAAELGLSTKTIETYRARIKKKLDIQKMSELATEATSWVLRRQSS